MPSGPFERKVNFGSAHPEELPPYLFFDSNRNTADMSVPSAVLRSIYVNQENEHGDQTVLKSDLSSRSPTQHYSSDKSDNTTEAKKTDDNSSHQAIQHSDSAPFVDASTSGPTSEDSEQKVCSPYFSLTNMTACNLNFRVAYS